jgi:hypothetical protein
MENCMIEDDRRDWEPEPAPDPDEDLTAEEIWIRDLDPPDVDLYDGCSAEEFLSAARPRPAGSPQPAAKLLAVREDLFADVTRSWDPDAQCSAVEWAEE